MSVYAQDDNLPKGTIRVFPDQIQWGEAPPSLPPGAKVYILEGNPLQDGIFTMRVKFPPYYKLPAHWHPKDERVTVIEGAVYVGFGETMDTTSAQKFSQGSYYVNPVESHHYVFTQSEGVVMQITGNGPWGITYIEEKK
jgi:quercetin dioxygenase-like cupin family protein